LATKIPLVRHEPLIRVRDNREAKLKSDKREIAPAGKRGVYASQLTAELSISERIAVCRRIHPILGKRRGIGSATARWTSISDFQGVTVGNEELRSRSGTATGYIGTSIDHWELLPGDAFKAVGHNQNSEKPEGLRLMRRPAVRFATIKWLSSEQPTTADDIHVSS
jgi:hypothetical protein